MGRVSKWILIEFKRDETSLVSEERKYGTKEQFNKARESLLFESNHHYFIYGALNDGKLTLKAKGYFNLIDIPVALLLTSGKDATSFTLYLKKLMNFKVGKEESDGSSGWRSVDYNRVIGIDESGDVSECLTIQEYANRYSHDLDLKKSFKLEQERKRSLEIKKSEQKIDVPKPR